MTAPYVLYLMRHGAPAVEGRLLGRTDPPVTRAGVDACMARVRGLDIARIASSDLARAKDCAGAIAVSRGMAVDLDPRWRELDFGAWDGLPPSAVDPVALSEFYEDPDAAPPPEGEQWSTLQGRVALALREMPPVATLVVTHGGAIRAALAELCGFDLRQIWAFHLPYAALVALRVWPGAVRTVLLVGLAT